jgi:hypothetical protein
MKPAWMHPINNWQLRKAGNRERHRLLSFLDKYTATMPRTNLSSTGYVRAKPGQEYPILQPGETTDGFTVILQVVTYTVEWFSVNSHTRTEVGQITVGSDRSYKQ